MFGNEGVTIGAWMLAVNVNMRTTRPLVNQSAHLTPLLFGIYLRFDIRILYKGFFLLFC